jgi:hypothetical protein
MGDSLFAGDAWSGGMDPERIAKPGNERHPDHFSEARVLTTKVALQLSTELPYEEWERAGRQLAGVQSSSSWWIGDWLNHGKEHYSDRYLKGVHAAGLKYQTLRNYAWVASRYPAARRQPELSFQHHAELASSTVDQQEFWLRTARRNGWTVKQLRTAVRQAGDVTGAGPSGERTRRLAVPSERFGCWREAAAQAGTDLEQWVILTLDSAAARILTAVPLSSTHGEIYRNR